MAVEMAGGKSTLRFGPCDPATFEPDLDWLQKELRSPRPPRLVYIVNPCNPTGACWRSPPCTGLDPAAAPAAGAPGP